MKGAVYLHDTPGVLRFQVRGALSRAEAESLEQCFQTAFSIVRGRPLVVDLTAATDVDEDGRRALSRLAAAGARFLAASEMAPLAGEIAGRPALPLPVPADPYWRRIACSAARLALALLRLPCRCAACFRPPAWMI